MSSRAMVNVLSVDVEECFHATEMRAACDPGRWPDLPSRVVLQTERLLEKFEQHSVRATFFVLGLVAHRHPSLIRSITDRGHEVGCHSYAHELVYRLSPKQFREDTARAVSAIEDACGLTPRVYRAPSYSITAESLWALEILVELGFSHDSSIYPIQHDRYGIPGFSRFPELVKTPSGAILEVPIATAALSEKRAIPVGGGGYLRLLPYRYTAAGIRRLNYRDGAPACIYLHPWELDNEQPRMATPLLARLRTYTGIRGMETKIGRLLSDFSFAPLTSVHAFPAAERPLVTECRE